MAADVLSYVLSNHSGEGEVFVFNHGSKLGRNLFRNFLLQLMHKFLIMFCTPEACRNWYGYMRMTACVMSTCTSASVYKLQVGGKNFFSVR